jgi:hypothetical protein
MLDERRPRAIAGAAVILAALAWAVLMPAPGSARPEADPAARTAVPYRNWARTPNNSAGVVFRPRRDLFEVWNNGPGDYGVSIIYNYKGVDDRWKSAGEIATPGRSVEYHEFRENRSIYFYILGPDNRRSPVSEYRTS